MYRAESVLWQSTCLEPTRPEFKYYTHTMCFFPEYQQKAFQFEWFISYNLKKETRGPRFSFKSKKTRSKSGACTASRTQVGGYYGKVLPLKSKTDPGLFS